MSIVDNIEQTHSVNYPMVDMDALATSPFVEFQQWFASAKIHEAVYPNAMSLATVDADGQPHSRIVLLKDFSEQGLTFFTNYDGAKAQQIEANNKVSVLFYWPTLLRQVRIEGTVQKTSREVSKDYFATRPRNSQLGAMASKQSQALSSRRELLSRFNELDVEYQAVEPSCPENWGGYLITPQYFEFWQAGDDRLHDRVAYSLSKNGWQQQRLYP